MNPYVFTKQVDYPIMLQNTIASSPIATPVHHIDTEGTGPEMIITVWFTGELSEDDLTTLNGLMDSYTNPSDSPIMIANLMTAIQSDANVILLLRAKIIQILPTMSNPQLRMACSVLGI